MEKLINKISTIYEKSHIVIAILLVDVLTIIVTRILFENSIISILCYQILIYVLTIIASIALCVLGEIIDNKIMGIINKLINLLKTLKEGT